PARSAAPPAYRHGTAPTCRACRPPPSLRVIAPHRRQGAEAQAPARGLIIAVWQGGVKALGVKLPKNHGCILGTAFLAGSRKKLYNIGIDPDRVKKEAYHVYESCKTAHRKDEYFPARQQGPLCHRPQPHQLLYRRYADKMPATGSLSGGIRTGPGMHPYDRAGS